MPRSGGRTYKLKLLSQALRITKCTKMHWQLENFCQNYLIPKGAEYSVWISAYMHKWRNACSTTCQMCCISSRRISLNRRQRDHIPPVFNQPRAFISEASIWSSHKRDHHPGQKRLNYWGGSKPSRDLPTAWGTIIHKRIGSMGCCLQTVEKLSSILEHFSLMLNFLKSRGQTLSEINCFFF